MYIKSNQKIFSGSLAFSLIIGFLSIHADAKSIHQATSGNFGLPGIIDLPTAKVFLTANWLLRNSFIHLWRVQALLFKHCLV